jgi:hypothetical protein
MRQVRAETTVGGLNSRSYLEWDYEGFQASVRGDGRVGHDERSDSYAWLIPASRLSHDHLEEVRGHSYQSTRGVLPANHRILHFPAARCRPSRHEQRAGQNKNLGPDMLAMPLPLPNADAAIVAARSRHTSL